MSNYIVIFFTGVVILFLNCTYFSNSWEKNQQTKISYDIRFLDEGLKNSEIYYTKNNNEVFSKKQKLTNTVYYNNDWLTVTSYINQKTIKKLRIDPSVLPGKFDIKNIKVNDRYIWGDDNNSNKNLKFSKQLKYRKSEYKKCQEEQLLCLESVGKDPYLYFDRDILNDSKIEIPYLNNFLECLNNSLWITILIYIVISYIYIYIYKLYTKDGIIKFKITSNQSIKHIFILSFSIAFSLFLINNSYICINKTKVKFDIKYEDTSYHYLDLFYLDQNNNKYSSSHKIRIYQQFIKNKWNTLEFNIPVNNLKSIRIDPSSKISKINIKNIRINGRDLLDENDILNRGNFHFSKYTKWINHCADKTICIESIGNDPYIEINKKVPYNYNNEFSISLFIVLCFSIFIVFYLILKIYTKYSYYLLTLPRNIKFLSFYILFFNLFIFLFFALMYENMSQELLLTYHGSVISSILKIVTENRILLLLSIIPFPLIILFNKCFIRLLVIFISIMVITVYILDIFSFSQLNSRFLFEYIFIYGKDLFSSSTMIKHFLFETIFGITIFSLLLCYTVLTVCCFKLKAKFKWLLSITTFEILTLIVIPSADATIWDYKYINVFSANIPTNEKKIYSSHYTNGKKWDSAKEVRGLNEKKNVILIIVESLSSFQSEHFGGIKNNTPTLDKIAKNNISFTNMMANGFNTDTGNFAILTGFPFFFGENNALHLKERYKDSLPVVLKQSGYSTYIIVGADDVGGIRDIYNKSNFEYAIGRNEKAYEMSESLTFNSVPDGDLFINSFAYIQKWMQSDTKFFSTIMTTTTHAPYIVPITHELSYDKTIQYVDKAIGSFINNLEKVGYFDDGILVITSDHRAMLPISSQEFSKYGLQAYSKIPLIIIDKSLKNGKVYSNIIGQDSIGKIIEYIVLDSVKVFPNQRIPLKEDDLDLSSNENVYYQKRGPRDSIIVYTEHSNFEIKLDGDNTSFNTNCLNKDLENKILNDLYNIRKCFVCNL